MHGERSCRWRHCSTSYQPLPQQQAGQVCRGPRYLYHRSPTLPSRHSCSDRVISNLAEYGNTSAASIPLALDEAVRAGTIKQGDVVAIAGFGAGLSWAAAILRWG